MKLEKRDVEYFEDHKENWDNEIDFAKDLFTQDITTDRVKIKNLDTVIFGYVIGVYLEDFMHYFQNVHGNDAWNAEVIEKVLELLFDDYDLIKKIRKRV